LKDRNATLWSSMVLQGPRHRVFFSGDTGLTSEFALIRERFGAFDLALLEVGAYHPRWGDIHLGPENALKALALLGNPLLLPVHWATFSLALHAWDAPAEELLALALRFNARLLMPLLGEAVQPAQAEGVRPWWRDNAVTERPDPITAAPVAEVAGMPKAMPWPLD
jgi:L-ascorbate metabolism protein UlaG (beta-lactamase superfamily)